MKQAILTDQLKELSPKGLNAYKTYLKGKYVNALDYILDEQAEPIDITNYTIEQLPLLSIGEMIEFIEQNSCTHGTEYTWIDSNGYDHIIGYGEHYSDKEFFSLGYTGGKLADILWDNVKEILEA